jgi:hypothetical protein
LFYVRGIGVDDGLVGRVAADGVVDILLRNCMALQQVLIAILGDLGEPEIGFGGAEVAQRLLELLVDFRSLDFGQELAFFDMRPYIEIPAPQITVRPRKNR